MWLLEQEKSVTLHQLCSFVTRVGWIAPIYLHIGIKEERECGQLAVLDLVDTIRYIWHIIWHRIASHHRYRIAYIPT